MRVAAERQLGCPLVVQELSRTLDDVDLAEDVLRLVDEAAISQEEWQQRPPVVVVPSFGVAAALVVTVIHGLSGYFPRIVWLRRSPATGAFDILEDVDLTELRMAARGKRGGRG